MHLWVHLRAGYLAILLRNFGLRHSKAVNVATNDEIYNFAEKVIRIEALSG
jgi:hypothetical protein